MAFTVTHIYKIMSGLVFAAILTSSTNANKMTLFDFTKMPDLDGWRESSDTVREVGKSKAAITLQRTQVFQRAIFFTLLNPQPNGAGFAGVRTVTNFDLADCKNLEITLRAQGENDRYKVVLRHKYLHAESDPSYEQFFTAPKSDVEFSTVTLPLSNFKPYHRGMIMNDTEPLDTSNITMFGLQIYGGVYLPYKQRGVSALELETVVAS